MGAGVGRYLKYLRFKWVLWVQGTRSKRCIAGMANGAEEKEGE